MLKRRTESPSLIVTLLLAVASVLLTPALQASAQETPSPSPAAPPSAPVSPERAEPSEEPDGSTADTNAPGGTNGTVPITRREAAPTPAPQPSPPAAQPAPPSPPQQSQAAPSSEVSTRDAAPEGDLGPPMSDEELGDTEGELGPPLEDLGEPLLGEPLLGDDNEGEPDDEPAAASEVALGEPSIAPYVLGGVGGALFVGASVVGFLALDAHSTLRADCENSLNCPAEFADRAESGETLALVADVLFGLTAATLVTALVLWLIDDSGERSAIAEACGPMGCGVRF